MADISNDEARRMALVAQGFDRPRPSPAGGNGSSPGLEDLRRVLSHVGLVQIDTVNVLSRAHYMPFFSRLGPYENRLIDSLAYEHRELFEYWGHEASFIPVELYPAIRHRMEDTRRGKWLDRIKREHPGFVESVYDQVRERGPLSVGELEDGGGRTGPWWGLSRGKLALEWHFLKGAVGVHSRRNFTRYYDLPERFIPASEFRAPALTEEEACRSLILLSARYHGIGTAADLSDYFRIKIGTSRRIIDDLVASGELVKVGVDGWSEPAYTLPGADVPAERITARSLVSPFDSLIWFRDRTERLFGMHYRIEIYVPEKKRRFGYYVLPFLLGEDLVARVDLKADRKMNRLLVQSAHLEDGRDAVEVSDALALELHEIAGWLGLDRVVVGRKGDLVGELRGAVKAARR